MFQYLRILFLTVCLVAMAASGWTWGNNEGALEQEQAGEEEVFGEEEAEGLFDGEDEGMEQEMAGEEGVSEYSGLYDDADRNDDDLIDASEFDEVFGEYDIEEDFADFDEDGDGFLDTEEWDVFANEYENEEWWEW